MDALLTTLLQQRVIALKKKKKWEEKIREAKHQTDKQNIFFFFLSKSHEGSPLTVLSAYICTYTHISLSLSHKIHTCNMVFFFPSLIINLSLSPSHWKLARYTHYCNLSHLKIIFSSLSLSRCVYTYGLGTYYCMYINFFHLLYVFVSMTG